MAKLIIFEAQGEQITISSGAIVDHKAPNEWRLVAVQK
jgi:hypothetical protein